MEQSTKHQAAEKRALALVELINYKYGGNAANLARAIGVSRSLVHAWTSFDKSFGVRAAENIEQKLDIPGGALQKGLLGFFEGWVEAGEPHTINRQLNGFCHPVIDVLDGVLLVRHPAINKATPELASISKKIEEWLKGHSHNTGSARPKLNAELHHG